VHIPTSNNKHNGKSFYEVPSLLAVPFFATGKSNQLVFGYAVNIYKPTLLNFASTAPALNKRLQRTRFALWVFTKATDEFSKNFRPAPCTFVTVPARSLNGCLATDCVFHEVYRLGLCDVKCFEDKTSAVETIRPTSSTGSAMR